MTRVNGTWWEDRAVLPALNAPIVTPRLHLEPLVAAHADALFGPLQDEAIYRWISTPVPSSVEALRARWARNESRVSPDGRDAWLNWAARRTSDGVYAGTVDVCIDPSVA